MDNVSPCNVRHNQTWPNLGPTDQTRIKTPKSFDLTLATPPSSAAHVTCLHSNVPDAIRYPENCPPHATIHPKSSELTHVLIWTNYAQPASTVFFVGFNPSYSLQSFHDTRPDRIDPSILCAHNWWENIGIKRWWHSIQLHDAAEVGHGAKCPTPSNVTKLKNIKLSWRHLCSSQQASQRPWCSSCFIISTGLTKRYVVLAYTEKVKLTSAIWLAV